MSTLLVTGGAGFIGSNFVHYALAHTTDRLLVVDKLTYAGSLLNLEAALTDPRVVFVKADIGDRDAMTDLLADHRPNAIINLAAETHVDRSIDGPRAFLETNVVATFEFLDVVRQFASRLTAADRERFRFLHVSTDEVYGTLDGHGAFSEASPYAPNSPYAASKAAADHFVRAYGHTYGLPVLTTNCSNNYGPYQFPEKLIPLMILNAIEGRQLPIYGDGGHVRDWLHVDDHCAGLLLVLQRGAMGENYNIGGGGERTNLAVIDELCRTLDELYPAAKNAALARASVSRYTDLKTFVPDRPGHDRRYAIDSAKVRRDLGWAPRQTFAEGLRATVRWYLEHRDWSERVQSGYNRERLGLRTS